MHAQNLLANIPADMPDELVEVFARSSAIRIERIVSHGHASPDGFWYDQDENEWVVILSGAARLEFEGRDDELELGPSEYVNIPAHVRHRVAWTTPQEPTVWLAVFY